MVRERVFAGVRFESLWGSVGGIAVAAGGGFWCVRVSFCVRVGCTFWCFVCVCYRQYVCLFV